MLGLLCRQWFQRYHEVELAHNGIFFQALYKRHCSDRMWEWQAISDELSLTLSDLAQKIFGANLERWPLPSWPEATKALPKSLPDKQWEDHSECVYGSPWYLEKGFTIGHAGCFAPRPSTGPPPRSALPEPASSKTSRLHFTGRDQAKQQSDGYQRPGAFATAGSSGNWLQTASKPPVRGSVDKSAAAYHSPEADIDVEEVYFTRSPGEPFHGTQFLRVPVKDEFTRMGWEKPGYVFEGPLDREVKEWIHPYPTLLLSQTIVNSGTAVG